MKVLPDVVKIPDDAEQRGCESCPGEAEWYVFKRRHGKRDSERACTDCLLKDVTLIMAKVTGLAA